LVERRSKDPSETEKVNYGRFMPREKVGKIRERRDGTDRLIKERLELE